MLKYIRHWSIFLLFNQIILLIGNSKVTDHHVFFDHCKFLFVCQAFFFPFVLRHCVWFLPETDWDFSSRNLPHQMSFFTFFIVKKNTKYPKWNSAVSYCISKFSMKSKTERKRHTFAFFRSSFARRTTYGLNSLWCVPCLSTSKPESSEASGIKAQRYLSRDNTSKHYPYWTFRLFC